MLVNEEECRGISSDGSEASGGMNDNERRWEIIKFVNDEEFSGNRSDVAAEAILLQRAIMGNDES